MGEARGGEKAIKEGKEREVRERKEGPWVHNPLTDSFVE